MIFLGVIEFHHHDKFGIGAAYDLWRDWKSSYDTIRMTASRLRLMDAQLAEDVDFVEDNWKKTVEEMWKKKISQLRQLGSQALVGRPDELLEMRGKEEINAKLFEA